MIDRFPGKFDISAGGHVNLGESLTQAAVRETREEIGAEISESDLRLLTAKWVSDGTLAWVFVTDWTGKEDTFHFDDQEVSEVKWVPYEETDKFRKEYAKESLVKDRAMFVAIDEWFKTQGLINENL